MSVRSSLESIFSHLYPAAAEDDLGSRRWPTAPRPPRRTPPARRLQNLPRWRRYHRPPTRRTTPKRRRRRSRPLEAAPSAGGSAARAAGRGRQAHDVGARDDPAHARGAAVGVEGGERAPDGGAAPRGEGGPVAAARKGLRVRPRAAEDGAADGRVDAPPRRLARRRARAAPPAPAAAVGAGGARARVRDQGRPRGHDRRGRGRAPAAALHAVDGRARRDDGDEEVRRRLDGQVDPPAPRAEGGGGGGGGGCRGRRRRRRGRTKRPKR